MEVCNTILKLPNEIEWILPNFKDKHKFNERRRIHNDNVYSMYPTRIATRGKSLAGAQHLLLRAKCGHGYQWSSQPLWWAPWIALWCVASLDIIQYHQEIKKTFPEVCLPSTTSCRPLLACWNIACVDQCCPAQGISWIAKLTSQEPDSVQGSGLEHDQRVGLQPNEGLRCVSLCQHSPVQWDEFGKPYDFCLMTSYDHMAPGRIRDMPWRSEGFIPQRCQDIIPNALIENIDASVVVQKKMKNLNVELIVRGWDMADPLSIWRIRQTYR